jgi:hypothetical protein
MSDFRLIDLAIAILALMNGGLASAGEYHDPSGFSFTYPDGWTVFRYGDKANEFEGVPPEVARWIKKNNMDLRKIAVTLVRNGDPEFSENFNVAVMPEQLPFDDKTVKSVAEMPKHMEVKGLTIEDQQTRIQKVGAHRAIVTEYRVKVAGVSQEMKQKQILIPSGGKTYWLTCSAKIETFAQYEETFDSIAGSLKLPVPAFMVVIQTLLVGIFVIGGLAAAVAGIRRFRRRKSQ